LHEKAEICPDCGVRNARSIERIPELSIILSAIIPGLGQAYNGQKIKALIFFDMGIILFLTTIIYKIEFLSILDKSRIFNRENLISLISNNLEWVYPIFIAINVFDAYRVAQNINSEI
jgi:hypothetical protein